MWNICTIQHYSAVEGKKKEIMKFAGKQMELETVLGEVTQTQKDKVASFLSFVFAGFESLDMCVLFGTAPPLSSKMEVSLKRIFKKYTSKAIKMA